MRIQDGQIYSVDLGRPLTVPDDLITDRGDAEVRAHDLHATLDACSAAVSDSVGRGQVPLVIGGDDSLLYACVRGFHDAVPGRVGVVHFDAHLDLQDHNEQQGSHSQSSGMRRLLELDRVAATDCIQIGLRHFNFVASGAVVADTGLHQLPAIKATRMGPDAVAQQILNTVQNADHIFCSFDIDAIDPAHAPGAGAHEPGGLTSRDAIDVIRAIAPRCDGLAITEVNPLIDVGTMTSTLAAYLIFHFAIAGTEP